MKVTTIYDAAYLMGSRDRHLYNRSKVLILEGTCPECLARLEPVTIHGSVMGRCPTVGPNGVTVYWSADERSVSKGEVFK